MSPYSPLPTSGPGPRISPSFPPPHKARPSRRRYILVSVAVLLFIIVASLWYKNDAQCGLSSSILCPNQASTALIHKNIVVASIFGWHFDVYLALVWSMQRVLKGRGNVQVYAVTPYPYDFQSIINELALYRGSFNKPTDLIGDLRRNTMIDMIVFGTCEYECVYLHLVHTISN
jgi:hypothetical protein